MHGTHRPLVTASLFALALAAPCARAAGAAPRAEPATLEGVPRAARDPGVLVAWNRLACDIGYAEDQFRTFKAHRAFTMMHLAMHDALNAIVPAYRSYVFDAREPGAHPAATAAQAAHAVLVTAYPAERARLDSALSVWLARAPDDSSRERGRSLGRRAAAAVIAARAGDGWDAPGAHTFRDAPGAYRTTPPWNGFVLQPGFRHAKPFAIERPDQFRPGPPPALSSAAYAKAWDEVRRMGRRDSRERSGDQTGYAVWWMEFVEGSVNRLARELATARELHLWRAARMFALLNMSLYDGYIATWDSKYEYDHWRPHTAIPAAAGDGNPATAPEPDWEPLRPTPPFPEYVSAHAAGAAASFEILARTLGDSVRFTLDTRTAPPGMPTRTFTSFRAAAAECADSRVRLGWHFRYASDAGLELGRSVAAWIEERRLRPR